MKKLFLTVTLFFLSIITLQSQQAGAEQQSADDTDKTAIKSYMEYTIGVNDHHIKDLYINPEIFQSLAPAFGVAYQRVTKSGMHEVHGGFSYGRFDWGQNSPEARQYIIQLNYTYLKHVGSNNIFAKNVDYYAGAGISTFISNTDVFTSQNVTWYGNTDKTWYMSNSLNMAGKMVVACNEKNSVSLSLEVPVYSLVSRPGHGHNFNRRNLDVVDNFLNIFKKMQAAYVWDAINPSGSIDYYYVQSAKLTLSAGMALKYASSERPQQLRMYVGSYHARLKFLL